LVCVSIHKYWVSPFISGYLFEVMVMIMAEFGVCLVVGL